MTKILIRGVCSNSGFGIALQGLIKVAIAAGHEVKFMPINAHALQHRLGFNKEDLDWLDSISITPNQIDPMEYTMIDVGSLPYAYSVPKIPAKKNILYCTYETVRIHSDYALDMMNNKYDEIWTASNFNKSSFLSSGVNHPIKVLPHYIDFTKFPNPEEIKPLNINNRKGYNFIYNADLSWRKGLHYLIPAFCETFKSEEDVSLTLKLMMSSPNKKEISVKIFESLNKLLYLRELHNKPRPTILVLIELLPYNLLPNFYKAGDCYVSPNMGEGFCYPIAESMACGLPQIATRCGAPLDYLNSKNSLMIDLDEKSPTVPITDEWQLKIDPRYAGQSLCNPSFESLKNQLRYAFEHKDEMKLKGIEGNKKIREYCSLENLAKKFNEIL